MKKRILIAAMLAMAVSSAWGQNGPVTSNLRRVLFYFYNFSGVDHQNTPLYGSYLMNLGAANGFTVDTTRSQSVFTAANLANYQVIFLFSAYYFGIQMTAAQQNAVQTWYGGNRGMACFHQCVRNQWQGTAPNWYDNLMGVQYQTYAGFTTGPVYVNADVVGTDLAMSSTGTQYPADYTQSWDDEWYTYLADPGALPNTKMIWTTRRSAFNFGSGSSGFNAALGEVQPMAWAREVQGGRFVLNSFFHRDAPRTSTNTALRQFIDGQWLGSLRYLAGYTGCMNPAYTEYNPKATHQGANACLTPTSIGAKISGDAHSVRFGSLKVSITASGSHSVDVYNAQGKLAASYNGTGPVEYGFPGIRAPGVYYVKVRTEAGSVKKRLFLL